MTLAHDLNECYRELGLPPGSSLTQVKKAYHSLAKELHPDLNPGAVGIMMSRVNKAYRVLKKHLEQNKAYKAYIYQTFDHSSAPQKSPETNPKAASPLNVQVKSDPTGLGPLGGMMRFPTRERHLGPLGDSETQQPPSGWRLLGLQVKEGVLVYKTEITGQVRSVALPMRRLRECSFCEGKGYEKIDPRGHCQHCGGKGRITCSEIFQVSLPRNWHAGQKIKTKAWHQGMPIVVELVAPLSSEKEK